MMPTMDRELMVWQHNSSQPQVVCSVFPFPFPVWCLSIH